MGGVGVRYERKGRHGYNNRYLHGKKGSHHL
jgi:hypothetical protein